MEGLSPVGGHASLPWEITEEPALPQWLTAKWMGHRTARSQPPSSPTELESTPISPPSVSGEGELPFSLSQAPFAQSWALHTCGPFASWPLGRRLIGRK